MKTLLGLALAAVIVIPAQAAPRFSVPASESPIIHVDNGCGHDKEFYEMKCRDRKEVLKMREEKEEKRDHKKEERLEKKKGGKESKE